jgi:uncharacterized protein with HEPN domain
MSNRDITLYIIDIFVSIDRIGRYVENIESADALKHDEMRWDAIIHEFTVIGEAVGALIRENVLAPERQRIVDFRNRIVHGYFGIDETIVWDAIWTGLPRLEKDMKHICIEKKIALNDAVSAARLENRGRDATLKFLDRIEKEMIKDRN